MPAPPTRRPRLLRESAAVGLGLLALYVATRSANFALAHDSLFYLNDVVSGDGLRLFHRHHLLYPSTAAGWLAGARALGVGGESAYILEALSALMGALAGALAYVLLRLRAGAPPLLALAGTLGATLSYGFWFYSASVEVCILPLPALLGALLVLSGGEGTSVRRAVAAGALLGLGALGHEAHALFGVPLLVLLALRAPGRPALRPALALAGTAAAVVVPAYLAVVVLALRPETPADVGSWLAGFAAKDTYWHAPGPTALVRAATGLARAVVGGHAVLAVPAVRETAAATFSPAAIADEVFLVRRLSPGLGVTIGAGFVLAWGGLAAMLVAGRRRSGPFRRHPLAAALVACFVVYALFFTVWDPQNIEFWIPQATALWLLAATLLAAAPAPRRQAGRSTVALLALAGLVGVVNLVGSVRPAMHPAGDPCRAYIGPLAGRAGPGDLIIAPHIGVVDLCGWYLTGAHAVTPTPETRAAVEAQAAGVRARGGRVFTVEASDAD